MKVIIRKEKEPYSRDGEIYRAYKEDGTPLYLGRSRKENLLEVIYENYGHNPLNFVDAEGKEFNPA